MARVCDTPLLCERDISIEGEELAASCARRVESLLQQADVAANADQDVSHVRSMGAPVASARCARGSQIPPTALTGCGTNSALTGS